MIDAIIFDADDTLWRTEELYDQALDLAQAEVERAGVDGSQWRSLQREIDLEAAKTLGFSAERFPLSSKRAYEELATEPVARIADKVSELSSAVFRLVAAPFPQAEMTLLTLRNEGYKLGLITKGDFAVQHKRIHDSGLAHYFEASAVVADKTSAQFAAMATLIGSTPGSSVSIGNSFQSDIVPAIEAGMRGIWIDAYVWERESHASRELPEGVIELCALVEIPEALRHLRQSA